MLSFNDFLNVANNAVLHLKAADVATKDRIARLIYLNVVVDTEKVVDFQIREPFKTYFRMHQIFTGRVGAIKLEQLDLLLLSLKTNWGKDNVQKIFEELVRSNKPVSSKLDYEL